MTKRFKAIVTTDENIVMWDAAEQIDSISEDKLPDGYSFTYEFTLTNENDAAEYVRLYNDIVRIHTKSNLFTRRKDNERIEAIEDRMRAMRPDR